MNLKRILGIKQSRKYPIRRDSWGRSLRARCFELFDEGMRPVEVARELKMNESTCFSYFQQWKKLGPNFKKSHDYLKSILNQPGPAREQTITLFSRAFGLPEEEIEDILARPHGLRRLLTGEICTPGQEDAASFKRRMSLDLGRFIAEYVTSQGGLFGDVLYALLRYIKEQRAYREWVDECVEEDNKEIALIRQFLEIVAETDRKGRPVADQLTQEEMNDIFRYGIEVKYRKVKELYWRRIDELKGSGLTEQQAHEKMYLDSVNQGDLRSALMMGAFQKRGRPLQKDKSYPNPSSPENPPPEQKDQ